MVHPRSLQEGMCRLYKQTNLILTVYKSLLPDPHLYNYKARWCFYYDRLIVLITRHDIFRANLCTVVFRTWYMLLTSTIHLSYFYLASSLIWSDFSLVVSDVMWCFFLNRFDHEIRALGLTYINSDFVIALRIFFHVSLYDFIYAPLTKTNCNEESG